MNIGIRSLDTKEELLSFLEIAEINFLMALKEVKPELVNQRAVENVNTIAWIVGLCVSHVDWYLFLLANKQLPTKEEGGFYDYGISKDRIKNYPYSYVKLLDAHLKITEKFYQILENLEEEKFEEIPHEKAQEKLSDLIKNPLRH